MSRPEHIAPPEIFYNDDEAVKYKRNTRMQKIQARMTRRAISLLQLPQPGVILDVGCGTGMSGMELERAGFTWVGVDISRDMLEVGRAADPQSGATGTHQHRGDALLSDMGQMAKFRSGVFDGCISISAIQWLCNRDSKSHRPFKRLTGFFQNLFGCLAHGARAVFQFYPESPKQAEMISAAAMKVGFSGGMVVDFPHSTKAKKCFLVLYAGNPMALPPPLREGDAAGAADLLETSESEIETSDSDEEGMAGDRSEADEENRLARKALREELRQERAEARQERLVAMSAGAVRPAERDVIRVNKREKLTAARKRKGGGSKKGRVLRKKESQRNRGDTVRNDTKFTARPRGPRF